MSTALPEPGKQLARTQTEISGGSKKGTKTMLAKQSPDVFIEWCFVHGHDFSGGHLIAGFYGAPQLLKELGSFMGNRLLNENTHGACLPPQFLFRFRNPESEANAVPALRRRIFVSRVRFCAHFSSYTCREPKKVSL